MSKSNKASVKMRRFEEAFSAEIKRIWKAAKAAPADADIKVDTKAKEISVQFRFSEDISCSEANASMERFIALFEEVATMRGITTERTTQTREDEAVAPKSVAASKTLNDSIGFAQPATVTLIRLIPMLREGLKSLNSRIEKANQKCLQIRSSGIAHQSLADISKSLIELKVNLADLAPVVNRFDLFDQTEAAFIESGDAEFYHDQGRECLGIERFLGGKLDDFEKQLEHLSNLND